jgi:hypothetical protein
MRPEPEAPRLGAAVGASGATALAALLQPHPIAAALPHVAAAGPAAYEASRATCTDTGGSTTVPIGPPAQ